MSIMHKYKYFSSPEPGTCVINSRFKRRKLETIVYGRYWRCQLFINISRHLKLEIVLAIPALNE